MGSIGLGTRGIQGRDTFPAIRKNPAETLRKPVDGSRKCQKTFEFCRNLPEAAGTFIMAPATSADPFKMQKLLLVIFKGSALVTVAILKVPAVSRRSQLKQITRNSQ